MVHVSRETAEQTRERLGRVLSSAEATVFPGDWVYRESAIDEPPELGHDVLAVVRDEESWSWLVRADRAGDVGAVADQTGERFAVFSFHFAADLDNSGFVGWLATEFKRRLGTGLFVVCGMNSRRGGIYDYWGCPAALREEVLAVLRELGAALPGPVDDRHPGEPGAAGRR